ncbi:helix-turn-helix domain-containing protein [Nonomuraea aridisoli]|uniref:Transcriptional regulator n=1 Tax=Nonomuraea aridisoli TaxID=2070368 RepID=A0A2W2DZ80_9ACTN|nr:helix-turn-helix domain-containing protein [Nonomuraea aridisoli]PZG15753.1 transcriptional regulator [Nonomuraea aridisoli]
MTDNELGAYLRARRESVRPADVGLPDSPRRRTPGLRRAELATLAGVSVEYLTRLEQGRDRNPSAQVLATLAEALRMTPEERVHLRLLSKVSGGGHALCPGSARAPSREVRRTVLALLDGLDPAPAVLLNRIGDVLAHTAAFRRVFGPVGLLDGDEPNLIRYVFADSRARIAYPDWDRVADEQAAALKLDNAPGDAYVAELTAELSFAAGEAFTSRMAAPAAPPPAAPVERLAHPETGELRLAREPLHLSDGEQRIVAYVPADAATAAALDHLTGRRPGTLRAVNDLTPAAANG